MHNNRKTSVSSSSGNPDDGSGSKQVWRVKSFELVPVREESHGVFYSGDCYVVLYTYLKNTKEYHIVYFWLVSQCFLFLLEWFSVLSLIIIETIVKVNAIRLPQQISKFSKIQLVVYYQCCVLIVSYYKAILCYSPLVAKIA